MTTTEEPVAPLAYADRSVVAAGGSPVAAGFWIMFGGLVLIFFGGCFCIGLLALITPQTIGFGPPPAPKALTWEQHLFMVALYVVATTCFVTGAWVMSLGIRKLMSVGR